MPIMAIPFGIDISCFYVIWEISKNDIICYYSMKIVKNLTRWLLLSISYIQYYQNMTQVICVLKKAQALIIHTRTYYRRNNFLWHWNCFVSQTFDGLYIFNEVVIKYKLITFKTILQVYLTTPKIGGFVKGRKEASEEIKERIINVNLV